ncbi:hypothetical protein RB598_004073 [Gaeumannomyces tritici]
MTRTIVYSTALVAFASVVVMTLASIVLPNWVSYGVTSVKGRSVTRNVGLHRSCSSVLDPPCREFPLDREDCAGDGSAFCSMWRTTGFLVSLAAVLELVTLVAFVVVMAGGKQKRVAGWRILAGLLSVVALLLAAVVSVVAYLYDNDDKFFVPGWHLDKSWILATVSASLSVLCAAGLVTSAFVLPQERGYEFLNNPDTA